MTVKCSYCNCVLASKFSFGPHSRICGKYKEFLKNFTKETLIDLYINQKMSCLDIQKHFNLQNHSLVYKKMKEFGIKIRHFSEVGKLAEPKRRITNQERIGLPHNFCKGGEVKNKIEADLKKEGLVNIFQRESVKLKIRKTLLERYGTECSWKTDTIRGQRSYSTLHKQVVGLCHDLNIDIKIEFKLKKNEDFRYYSYDIILENTKKIIEVYGDYWHGNPKLYKSSDILLKGSSREMTVKEKRTFDKKKNKFALSKGYSVLILWEKDIKENLEKIKEIIQNYSSTKHTSLIFNSSTLL